MFRTNYDDSLSDQSTPTFNNSQNFDPSYSFLSKSISNLPQFHNPHSSTNYGLNLNPISASTLQMNMLNGYPTRKPQQKNNFTKQYKRSMANGFNKSINSIHQKCKPFKTNGHSNGIVSVSDQKNQRFDAQYKVLLLGNSGVGKTSIIRSLAGESFFQTTISTIGKVR